MKLPKDKKVVRVKWVFRNKLDEDGMVLGNKERLVAKVTHNRKVLIILKLMLLLLVLK